MAKNRDNFSRQPSVSAEGAVPPGKEAQQPTEGEASGPLEESKETLPNGLKELDSNPSPAPVEDAKESALCDRWEKCDRDGEVYWINRRDFNTKGGSVPQGVIRSTEEALVLEGQRCG